MALFRPCSKSTKVSAAHSFFCSSSRVTVSPGRSNSMTRISAGWPCSLIFMPFLRSSPARGSSSNAPKQKVGGIDLEVFTTTPQASRMYTLWLEVHAAQQSLKPGFRPQGIQQWLRLQIKQRRVLFVVGLLEERKGPILVA